MNLIDLAGSREAEKCFESAPLRECSEVRMYIVLVNRVSRDIKG